MGSGTVAKASMLTNRNYLGFEISEEYCKIAEERIANTAVLLNTGQTVINTANENNSNKTNKLF